MQTSPLNLTLNEQAASNSSDSGGVNINMMIRTGAEDEEEGLISSSIFLPDKQEPTSPRSDEAAPTSGRDLSEDLQKLQTMLLQLNALNGSSLPCRFGPQQENVTVPCENVRSQQSVEENGTVQGEQCDSPRPSSIPSPSSPLLDRQQQEQQHQVEQTQLEGDGAAACDVCGQDIYPSSLLGQHMAEEHGTTTPPPPQQQIAADEVEVGDNNSLGSGNMPFYSTSCYCDICNKELCNKYFKKVHMQKMHGIEIKDNALSGGVPCDICHKQLCSKYFVRVHKQNTHGIVDLSAPSGAPSSGRAGAGSPLGASLPSLQSPLPQPQDASLKPAEVADLSHRYYTHFNVVCPLCSRRFRSAKWLKAHLVNDHADAGLELARELEPKFSSKSPFKSSQQSEENDGLGNNLPPPPPPPPMPAESATAAVLSSLLRSNDERSGGSSYHCSYCNFSTPVLSLLFVHERSHTGLPAGMPAPNTRPAYSCHLCFKSFGQAELLQRHLRTHQLSGLQGAAEERQDEVEETGESPQQRETKDVRGAAAGRYRCAQCHQRFRTRDLWSAHMQNHSKGVDTSGGERSTGPPYCCPLCSYSTDVLASFKKHVKHEHWPGTEGAAQSRLWRSLAQVEVSRTLQDAARESHVPATYAVPQAPPEHGDRFIMQPFLLEEPPDSSPAASSQPPPRSPLEGSPLKREEPTTRPRSPASSGGDETEQVQHATTVATTASSADGTFVPSLVFLPVREKVSGTLTVSFTLTPA